MKTIPGANQRRRGAALLEAALALPILLLLTFGVVELGDFYFTQHQLKGAASAGARAAIPKNVPAGSANTVVDGIMASAGFPAGSYTTTLTPPNPTTAPSGTLITVEVDCTWGTVGIRPLGILSSSGVLRGKATMQKE